MRVQNASSLSIWLDWPVVMSAWILSSSLIAAQKKEATDILGAKVHDSSPRPEWICVPGPITKADLRRHGECINFRKCVLIRFFWRTVVQAHSRNKRTQAAAC
jgi:hypothetical protein